MKEWIVNLKKEKPALVANNDREPVASNNRELETAIPEMRKLVYWLGEWVSDYITSCQKNDIFLQYDYAQFETIHCRATEGAGRVLGADVCIIAAIYDNIF